MSAGSKGLIPKLFFSVSGGRRMLRRRAVEAKHPLEAEDNAASMQTRRTTEEGNTWAARYFAADCVGESSSLSATGTLTIKPANLGVLEGILKKPPWQLTQPPCSGIATARR
jgi:hypothetical protein